MFSKKTVLVIAKILFSVGLIYWLLRGADLETIWETVRTAKIGYLMFAFSMFYIGFVLISIRWRMLLRVENIDAKILYLLESVNIAVLFNNLLPSTIGGDAYRMYDVWRLGANKTKSILIILIDRFLGMLALVTYGLIAAIVATEVRQAIPGLVFYLSGVLLAMLAIMWMAFGSGASILQWFLDIESRLLSIPQRVIGKITEGLALYRGRGDVLLKAILVSFGIQLNVILHFVIISYALSIDVPWQGMFIIIPLATLIMLAPVSINGVGVREAVLVFFFSLYGVNEEAAIAFAWVWLAMLLAQGVVGGVVLMLRRQKATIGIVKDLME
jgi:uncharacterized protein (TIRG00374 family)